MVSYFREVVSGKKNRFTQEGYNLDLTYVCSRIIAMAFPASGLQVIYRNNISDVSELLNKRHPHKYKVYNLSGLSYDYSKFENRVEDLPWEDHHSPPIHTLFLACDNIHKFLQENKENVVAVHCLAGKGRTGTVICCYLLYSGRFKHPEEALDYYAKKRFTVEGLGVTQPSQIRYIHYFYKLLKDYRISPTVKLIDYIKLSDIPAFSHKNSCKPIFEIISAKDYEKKYDSQLTNQSQPVYRKKKSSEEISSIVLPMEKILTVFGDILIKFKNNGFYRKQLMFRFAFNTAFIPESNILTFDLNELDPDSIRKNDKFPSEFYVEIKFKNACNCTSKIPFEAKCGNCQKDLADEQSDWEKIYQIMKNYKEPSLEESKILLFGDEPDPIEYILKENFKNESILEKPKVEDSSDEDDDEMKKIFNNIPLRNSNSSKEKEKEKIEITPPPRYFLQKTKSFRQTDEERKPPILVPQKSKEN